MTSTLIPTNAIEELVQSGLPTRALSHHVDAADASITDLYGAHAGERTVTLRGNRSLSQRQRPGSSAQTSPGYFAHAGGEWRVHLPYPWAASVTGVAEYTANESESDAKPVDPSSYALELGGRALRRLDRPWRTFVALQYTPIDDTPKRTLLLIDLVKLSIRYTGVRRSDVGSRGVGLAVDHLDYETERRKLLRRLMPNRPGSMMA